MFYVHFQIMETLTFHVKWYYIEAMKSSFILLYNLQKQKKYVIMAMIGRIKIRFGIFIGKSE